MMSLCPEPGCHRPKNHSERTHKHVRWIMGPDAEKRGELTAIEWPDHGSIVVITQAK